MQGTWGRSPGRADRVSAGPVVSNSEPLSPCRTPGLACGGKAVCLESIEIGRGSKSAARSFTLRVGLLKGVISKPKGVHYYKY